MIKVVPIGKVSGLCMTSHKVLVGSLDNLYMWEPTDKRIVPSPTNRKVLICTEGFYFLGAGIYDRTKKVLVVENKYYRVVEEVS